MDNLRTIARDRRLSLGLTQKQVAEKANCSRDTVNTFENDRRDVYLDVMLSIFEALGLRLVVEDDD